MSLFSLPPLSISLGLPNPLPTNTLTDTFTVPSITVPIPGSPTTTVRPPKTHPPSPPPPPTTTTERQTTPTVPVSPSSSSTTPSSEPSRPPSAPESSPASNVISGVNTSTTSTKTVTLTPTGKLSPSQPNMSFLENKGAKAGVFSVVAIVALFLFIGIGALIYRRRRRRRFDLEHSEAMVGYAPRLPIDGDDDYPSSHSQSNPALYHSQSQKSSDEMAPSTSNQLMRQRYPDEVPVYLTYNHPRPPQEYNPYREHQDPFVDNRHIEQDGQPQPQPQHWEQEGEHIVEDESEESLYLEPPSPWPPLGQLPRAFGSPGSEVTLEFPRPALRVTNGLDDTHA